MVLGRKMDDTKVLADGNADGKLADFVVIEYAASGMVLEPPGNEFAS